MAQYVRTSVFIFSFNSFAPRAKYSRCYLLFNINNNIKPIRRQIITASPVQVSFVSGKEGISKDVEHFNILL